MRDIASIDQEALDAAAALLSSAHHAVAFSGAGISVESGIPAFRGVSGIWSRYDPACLDIETFHAHPENAWPVIKEIFYDFFGRAEPNPAHSALAQMEQDGLLSCVITQNIDNLHQRAGSRTVIEFHGTSRRLVCTHCGRLQDFSRKIFDVMPPRCLCGGVLKPDFVFFGEPIPWQAHSRSVRETEEADLWLVIGTTGEVQPASWLPYQAKQHGAVVIEVNVEPSAFTDRVTDIFLCGKAGSVLPALLGRL